MRFEQATRALLDDGVTAFVEVSSHPVLTWAVQETVDVAADPDAVAVVGSLRRDEGTLAPLPDLRWAKPTCAVSRSTGTSPSPARKPSASGCRPTPSSARRFWLPHGRSGGTDLAAAGLAAAEHPLLAAAVPLAGQDAWLFTGRLSLDAHPWLADHAVQDTVLLPATAFLELALRAAQQVGCDTVDELTLEAPLVLPEDGAVRLQVTVGERDGDGLRPIDVHALPDGGSDAGWVSHASGTVSASADVGPERIGAWPPTGAQQVDAEQIEERLANLGYVYGPAFQGMRAAWQRGEELFVEVALDPERADEAGRYRLHPALLDAALHPAFGRPDDTRIRLPFSWTGVRLLGNGAAALRVRMAPVGEDVIRIDATDGDGAAILSVAGLRARPFDGGQVAGTHDALFRVAWVAIPAGERPARLAAIGEPDVAGAALFEDLDGLQRALAAGLPAPDAVLVRARPDARAALALVQAWLEDERLARSPSRS